MGLAGDQSPLSHSPRCFVAALRKPGLINMMVSFSSSLLDDYEGMARRPIPNRGDAYFERSGVLTALELSTYAVSTASKAAATASLRLFTPSLLRMAET